MPTPRSRLGTQGESIAAAHLEAQGFRVIARNVRSRYGEVDLVAEDGATTVFVEVKARRAAEFGAPEESVTPHKRERLVKTALSYLGEHGLEQKDWRIDVVAITLQRDGPATIRHIRAA